MCIIKEPDRKRQKATKLKCIQNLKPAANKINKCQWNTIKWRLVREKK